MGVGYTYEQCRLPELSSAARVNQARIIAIGKEIKGRHLEFSTEVSAGSAVSDKLPNGKILDEETVFIVPSDSSGRYVTGTYQIDDISLCRLHVIKMLGVTDYASL